MAAIVLIGAKAEVNPDPSLRDAAIRVLETQGIVAAWRNYWLPLFADTTSSQVKESAQRWALQQDVGSVVNGVRAFHNRRDLSSFAAEWRRPLIGISGDRDLAPSPSKLRHIATGPNRAFHLVHDCGHYVNLEQPSMFEELLAEAIRPIIKDSESPIPNTLNPAGRQRGIGTYRALGNPELGRGAGLAGEVATPSAVV